MFADQPIVKTALDLLASRCFKATPSRAVRDRVDRTLIRGNRRDPPTLNPTHPSLLMVDELT